MSRRGKIITAIILLFVGGAILKQPEQSAATTNTTINTIEREAGDAGTFLGGVLNGQLGQ